MEFNNIFLTNYQISLIMKNSREVLKTTVNIYSQTNSHYDSQI